MSEERWTSDEWGESGPPQGRLPRAEDLPAAEHGYDRAAVEAAFDDFYRHAAQLDATLRVLESVEVFGRQAGELRADIRALRAAAWGPLPATPLSWTAPGYARASAARPGAAVAPLVPRLAAEAVFIVLVPVVAALAGLETVFIVLAAAAAWLIVGAGELLSSTHRVRLRPGVLPRRAGETVAEPRSEVEEPRAEPAPAQPTMVDAPHRVEAEPVIERELVSAEELIPVPPPEEEPVAEAASAAAEPARRRWFGRPVQPAAASVTDAAGSKLTAEPEAPVDAAVEPEIAPAPEPEVAPELEQEIAPEPETAPESEPEATPEPVISAAAREPEPEEGEPEPVAEATPSPELAKPRRRWFGRAAAPAAEAAPEPVQASHVRVLPVEPVAPAAESEPWPERAEELEPAAEAQGELPVADGSLVEEREPPPVPSAEAAPFQQPAEPEADSEPDPDPLVVPEAAPFEEPGDEEDVEEAPAAEIEPEPSETRARRWFWRRRHHEVQPVVAEEPAWPSHVRVVEIERAVVPEEVEVGWQPEPEAEEEGRPGDPWEQAPELAGIELPEPVEAEAGLERAVVAPEPPPEPLPESPPEPPEIEPAPHAAERAVAVSPRVRAAERRPMRSRRGRR